MSNLSWGCCQLFLCNVGMSKSQRVWEMLLTKTSIDDTTCTVAEPLLKCLFRMFSESYTYVSLTIFNFARPTLYNHTLWNRILLRKSVFNLRQFLKLFLLITKSNCMIKTNFWIYKIRIIPTFSPSPCCIYTLNDRNKKTMLLRYLGFSIYRQCFISLKITHYNIR